MKQHDIITFISLRDPLRQALAKLKYYTRNYDISPQGSPSSPLVSITFFALLYFALNIRRKYNLLLWFPFPDLLLMRCMLHCFIMLFCCCITFFSRKYLRTLVLLYIYIYILILYSLMELQITLMGKFNDLTSFRHVSNVALLR
jgi:hypothetical protein